MIKQAEFAKKWLVSNVAMILAITIFTCLRLSWKQYFLQSVPLDIAIIISVCTLTLSQLLHDKNEKIVLSLTYLCALASSPSNALLTLAVIIFAKFLLERTQHLLLVGLLLLSTFLERMSLSLGLELALTDAPIILMYTHVLLILITLILCANDKTVLLSLLAIMASGVLGFDHHIEFMLWPVVFVLVLAGVKVGLLKSICTLLFFLALTKGDYYLFAIGFVISVLDSFKFKAKSELLPAIGILSIGESNPNIALFFFVMLTINTLSRSRVQAWLMKHHS